MIDLAHLSDVSQQFIFWLYSGLEGENLRNGFSSVLRIIELIPCPGLLQIIWYVQNDSPSLYVLSEYQSQQRKTLATYQTPRICPGSWSIGVQEMFDLRDISQMEREMCK